MKKEKMRIDINHFSDKTQIVFQKINFEIFKVFLKAFLNGRKLTIEADETFEKITYLEKEINKAVKTYEDDTTWAPIHFEKLVSTRADTSINWQVYVQ